MRAALCQCFQHPALGRHASRSGDALPAGRDFFGCAAPARITTTDHANFTSIARLSSRNAGYALMAGRLIGYARATLTGPSLDDQEKALRRAGCKVVFRDDLPQRPARRFAQRAAAIEDLEKGDIFVIGSLDRLASSLPDLVATIWSIICLGCGVRTLAERLNLDPDGADDGRALIGAIAAAAKAQNAEVYAESESKRRVRRGRKDALSDEDWPKIAKMLEKQSVSDVARQFGVSRPTIYRLRKRME